MSFVRSGDVDLYYEVHGSGPAVLFCHGAGSNAATWWQQLPLFSRHYQCITYDHRGFGRSPVDAARFEPSRFIDDALAVLDAAGARSAALVCQSLGGMTGLRLALAHPHRVWAFACCDSPLSVDHPEMNANVRRFLASVKAGELENRALSAGFVAREPALAGLYAQINRFNPGVYAEGHGGADWSARMASLFAPDYMLRIEQVAGLRVPSLFVVGAEDPVVTPHVVRDIASRVRGAEVLEIPLAGHSPYYEQAEVFNEGVLRFLSKQRPMVALS